MNRLERIAAVVVAAWVFAANAAGPGPDFNTQIRPILESSCYRCHGPTSQMSDLRLDSRTDALKGGRSGKAIVPGRGAESLLIERLLGNGSKPRMPFQSSALPPAQIALLRAWIDRGAVWPSQPADEKKSGKHWAYVKPVRPEAPRVNAAWVRNPIDAFVLDRLNREGLSPSPEASRETLIRRVSLDLIGLPPGIEEVNAFLADTSPGAYERVVDRLLASPHYGERWARPWLDLARYADTNGYADNRRQIWKYRDWVIQALNRDMPFNQFTIEQIAGDMLPNATVEQKIATGFHRNTMFNDEGGVDPDEARWITMVDRVGTTASVWLGQTLACAQCHDHKFDPFTQKDFYRMLAFFESADYTLEGETYFHRMPIEPVLDLPTPEQESWRKEITRLEEVLQSRTPELDREQARWERDESTKHWLPLEPSEFTATGGSIKKLPDQSLLVTPKEDKQTYRVVARTDLKGITAVQLEALPHQSLPALGPGLSPDGNFFLTSARIESGKPVVLKQARAAFAQEGYPASLVLDQDPETGWAILPRVGQAHSIVLDFAASLEGGAGTVLTINLDHRSKAALGRFRLSVSADPGPAAAPPLPQAIRVILSKAPQDRSGDEKEKLSAHYRSIAPKLQPARDRLLQLRAQLEKSPITTTLIMRERVSGERPSTYLRVRGNFLAKGEQVYSGVPRVLHPLSESAMPNRLGLARWLVDENNPLVARVAVNRYWEQIFGRGLVETVEDFGKQGQLPSHPELLDWLATEFMGQGWSVKSIHRLLVTSAAYRQSSRITSALRERDPYNTLLARGPRFRMEAEMVRDSALTAAGLLDRAVGGPSVMPFQPDGVWNSPYYTDYQWVNGQGSDRYRRGVYTFWRRTAPYASFMAFDAASREFCTVRRTRTNTPLQALTVLNDPAFFDAARALAKRILNEAAQEAAARADHGFRLCVSRRPSPQELDRLLTLHRQQVDHFRSHPEAASQLVQQAKDAAPFDVAELAAWTVLSNTLLNLDEALTKE